MPILSIIVPVYKVEDTLHRCVDSILCKKCVDYELLLVDDGSPDNCGEICDDYGKTHTNVHVFHKENGGVSSARNVGLDHAKGEWIWFVDSDDTITEGSLDFISKGIIETKGQTCALHYGLQKINGGRIAKTYIPNNAIWHAQDFICKILNYQGETGPVTYIFRKEAIGSLRFNTQLTLGEDTMFDLNFFQKNKHAYIESHQEIIYNYIQYPNSATNNTNLSFIQQYADLEHQVVLFVNKNNLPQDVRSAADYFITRNKIEVVGRLSNIVPNYAMYKKHAEEIIRNLAQTSNRTILNRFSKKLQVQVRLGQLGPLAVFLFLKSTLRLSKIRKNLLDALKNNKGK